MTALTAGLGYLATQEDAATKFSREHADALMLVSDNTGTAASALDAYREQLKGMTAERLKFEQASVSANLQHVAGGDMLNGSAYKNIMSEVVPMALFDGNAPAMREQLREAMASLLPTNIANATLAELEAVKQKLMELGVQYNRTGETSSAITKFLDPLIALKIQQEAVTAQAGNVASGLDGIGGSASAAASGVNSLVVELGKLDPKRLANVMSSLEFKSYAKELKGVEKFKAEQLNAAGLSAEAVKGVMSGNRKLLTPDISKLLSLAGQAYTPPKKTKAGASKAVSAKTYLQGVEAEIAGLLNNGGEAFGVKLDKKLAEIAKRGKDAGLSLSELTAVTTRYAEAANADNIRKQSEALDDVALSVARLSGDWRTVNKMELDREADNLTRKLLSLGVAQGTVTAKVNEYRAAKKRNRRSRTRRPLPSFTGTCTSRPDSLGWRRHTTTSCWNRRPTISARTSAFPKNTSSSG